MFAGKSREEIEESLKKYPNKKSAVMDMLRIAQKERGHITKQDMEEISELLEINPIVVNSAATFYTMYEVDRPIGKHHIWVCRNISCSLLGADHIMSYLEDKLGIKMGETTSDGNITLDVAECLGSCGTAPMMQIDDDYHENLTEEKIDKILEGLD